MEANTLAGCIGGFTTTVVVAYQARFGLLRMTWEIIITN
jgi:hypothetical protein